MQKYLLFLLLLPTFLYSNGQVNFEKTSLTSALLKAREENKMVFLQLESPGCTRCNEVADIGFKTSFPDSLVKRFVFIKLAADNPERTKIDKVYNTPRSAGTLFLNSNGTLIHRFTSTTTMSEKYFEEAAIALRKNTASTNISVSHQTYLSGNRSINFLERYISERNELNLPTDSLLNEYISVLPQDSMKSLRVLKFIAVNAPVIGSTADNILRHDYAFFSQAWFNLPLQQRITINRRVIAKSKQKAVSSKDFNYLTRVATFAKATYQKGSIEGEKIYNNIFLEYYKQIKDTVNYIQKAIDYYDKYLMTVSIELIKQKDSLRRLAEFKKVRADTNDFGEGVIVQKTIAFAPELQYYADELNTGAWNVYTMSNDLDILEKALGWSKTSVNFYSKVGNLDTYARLLYKTGNRKEAVEQEKKAIAIDKSRGFNTAELERVLNRMQVNLKVIDD